MDLGRCCFRGCTKSATIKGFIYGHFKENEDKKDKFIDLVACDEHAKEKDFYLNSNEEN